MPLSSVWRTLPVSFQSCHGELVERLASRRRRRPTAPAGSITQRFAGGRLRPARVADASRPARGPRRVGRAVRSKPHPRDPSCVIEPTVQWVVEPARLASRAVNSPWADWKLTGKIRHTILRGMPTVRDGEPTQ